MVEQAFSQFKLVKTNLYTLCHEDRLSDFLLHAAGLHAAFCANSVDIVLFCGYSVI